MSQQHTDIWGRTYKVGSVLPGERIRMTLSTGEGTTSVGALVNEVRIRQERSVLPVLDLISGDIWQLAYPPRPVQIVLQGFVTDSESFETFLQSLANACSSSVNTLTISITPGSCGENPEPVRYVIQVPRLAAVEGAVKVEESGATFIGAMIIVGISLNLA